MRSASPCIPTVNGGSSSFKFAMFETGGPICRILDGAVERIGLLGAALRVKGTNPADNVLRHASLPGHKAAEAVALFCYQAEKWIGAFAAALGGLDALVFAGGIGENAPTGRSRICHGLEFLGIDLDQTRNTQNAPMVSTDADRVKVGGIHTDEELMIARSVVHALDTRQETRT